MGLKIEGTIERVDGRKLSYEEFVERYLKTNTPVLLTGLMDEWRACTDWVTHDGLPNLHFFSSHFGNSMVQVADCCRKECTDQKRVEMSVSEFISHWLGLSAGECTDPITCKDSIQSLLYLKDWHFIKEYPEYVAYTTPPFFVDDWLNLYLDSHYMHQDSDIHRDKNEINCSDYRFVYMGRKGTWTPLHADVFRSYSWSANVCGRKRWLLLPPPQCHLVFDRSFKRTVYDIYDDVCETQFPGFKKTSWLECTQEQNEIIFVPSGWYHQVHNLEDTISINHNWFNAYNLSWVWNLLMKDYSEAKEYIEDIRDICDDFEGLCQRNLAANSGMNFLDFFIFISRFALANVIQLCYLRNEEDTISKASGKAQHLIDNLKSIYAVASNMKSLEAFSGEILNTYSVKNNRAYSDVRGILKEPDFLKLCMELMKTYETMDGLWKNNSKMVNTSTCGKDCLEVDCWRIDFTEASGSKIYGPDDLIRLIEDGIKNLNFALPSELCDLESSDVEQQS